MKWILRKLAGSKADKLYQNTLGLLGGYKTYMVGLVMVLRGAIAFIDASQGSNIGDLLELLRHESVEQMAEGLGLMTLRAGVAKIEMGTKEVSG